MKIKCLCLVCNKEFYTVPSRIADGKDKTCSKKCGYLLKSLSKEEYIKRCHIIHNNKYDYGLTDYTKMSRHITIICPTHGPFIQLAGNHLYHKNGCPICGKEDWYITMFKEFTTERFIQEGQKIYGDTFDYSKTNYINSKTNVIIICKIHGEFSQRPSHHLDTTNENKLGCPSCAMINMGLEKRIPFEQFLTRSIKTHGLDTYDYSLSNYQVLKDKIKIICPIHGLFEQMAMTHLNGNGCPKCKLSKGEKSILNYCNLRNIKVISEFEITTNNTYRLFDFNLSEYQTMIEYHGIHHYAPCSFGSKRPNIDMETLTRTVKSDYQKKLYCKNNGIRLLVIPYWNYKFIDLILDNHLYGTNHQIPYQNPPKEVILNIPIKRRIIKEIILTAS